MVTRLVLLHDLCEKLNQKSHFPVRGIATDATITTLVDSGLAQRPGLLYSSGDANAWDRKWVYIEPHSDETRVTEDGYVGSTGTLTLSPALVTDIGATGTATSTTSTSLTDTGAAFNTSGVRLVGAVVQADDSRLTVTSNTGTVLTGTGGWDNGTPAGTAAYTVGPPYMISDVSFREMINTINTVLRSSDGSFPELSADTDSTPADQHFIVWTAIWLIKLNHGDEDWRDWAELALARAERLSYPTLLPIDDGVAGLALRSRRE